MAMYWFCKALLKTEARYSKLSYNLKGSKNISRKLSNDMCYIVLRTQKVECMLIKSLSSKTIKVIMGDTDLF